MRVEFQTVGLDYYDTLEYPLIVRVIEPEYLDDSSNSGYGFGKMIKDKNEMKKTYRFS